MAWDTELVSKLRLVINDLDATSYTWTDNQLKQFIMISLGLLDSELSQWYSVTGGPYTISFDDITINPDPTVVGSSGFNNLIVLQAAVLISQSELKKLNITAGWKIVDDKSTIDGTNALAYGKETYTNYLKLFLEALNSFKVSGGGNVMSEAILSPYAPFEGGENR